MPPAAPDFTASFRPAACAVALAGANKDAVLERVVDLLARSKQLPASSAAAALRALLDRERVASTGVGLGVAIPHVQLKGIERAALSLCVTAADVAWQSLDGAGVRVVFAVIRPDKAGPKHDPQRHLALMQWISRIGRDADFRRFAGRVETKAELLALLAETARRLEG
ncbi:MAG: PTS sugar transporter subunit IIA [Planctomycetota bacterium]|nr:MAG: PTS sugar transporter subunit IIA [Planctomycetota bacterium]